jgi:hypothetical protein
MLGCNNVTCRSLDTCRQPGKRRDVCEVQAQSLEIGLELDRNRTESCALASEITAVGRFLIVMAAPVGSCYVVGRLETGAWSEARNF